MIKFKQVKVSEPELITNPDEIRYCNEILPLKAEISELEQETIKLKEVLDELNQDKVYWINKCANAETVLDEIREYIVNDIQHSTYGQVPKYQDILQILDKVKQ